MSLQDRLRHCVRYDRGEFFYQNGSPMDGKKIMPMEGYLFIPIDGKLYGANPAQWARFYFASPEQEEAAGKEIRLFGGGDL